MTPDLRDKVILITGASRGIGRAVAVAAANAGAEIIITGRTMGGLEETCLLYTSPSPRDKRQSRMPSSA